MAFEQKLRGYLEAWERASPTDVPLRQIDEHELHRHLLDRLRTMESAGAAARVKPLFVEWTNKLARFARYLETFLAQLAPTTHQEAMVFACRALDVALDCLDPDVSVVDRLEAERAFAGFVSGLALLESYSLENHLVRRDRLHPVRSAVGTVGAFRDGDAIELISMWVAPAARGRGIGAALVRRVLGHAREASCREVRLWVTDGNAAAERLYARCGFARTGALQPIRSGEPALESEMCAAVVGSRS